MPNGDPMSNQPRKDVGKTRVQPTYVPPPKVLPAFPKAKPAKRKGGGGAKRRRWVDPDSGDILEWDGQHGKIERYNDRGKHLGEYDPDSGQQTKPADPTRTVTPTIWKKKKAKMVYYLTWFEKDGDDYLGEVLLKGISEDEVRKAFDLADDDPPGDCFEVDEHHVKWLAKVAHGVKVQLDSHTYFVEASQS